MRLERHARLQQAIVLIERAMRTSIVARITDVAPGVLRELYQEIHGRRPAPGQLPSTSGILRSPRSQASASVFAALYRVFGGEAVHEAIDLDALLSAHRLYLEQIASVAGYGELGKPIDINQAWVLARDLTTGMTAFRFCGRCNIRYLAADFSRTALRCPICALKPRRVGLSATVAPSSATGPNHGSAEAVRREAGRDGLRERKRTDSHLHQLRSNASVTSKGNP